MADVPVYFRLFIDDYERDAGDLSLIQHGIYFRLMLWYYGRAAPIPDNINRICARLGIGAAQSGLPNEEWFATKALLERFFQHDKEAKVYRHKRIDAELDDWCHRTGVGRTAAEKRWKINGNDNANALPTHSERNANQNQNQNQKKNIKHSAPEFPEWLPKPEWDAWLEMRERLKAPPTPAALKINLRKLEALRAEGHDPAAVLDQSTARGWRGLFGIRDADVQAGPRKFSDEWIDLEMRAGRLKVNTGETYYQVRQRLMGGQNGR